MTANYARLSIIYRVNADRRYRSRESRLGRCASFVATLLLFVPVFVADDNYGASKLFDDVAPDDARPR